MKTKQFLSKGTYLEKVFHTTDYQNKMITDAVKGRMTTGRLTFMALKNEEVKLYPFDVRYPDSRVWTRGDGSRYKDPGYIRVIEANMRSWHIEYSSFKTLYPNKQYLLNYFWEQLKNAPRAKDLGTLSGCFKGDDQAPAIRANGLLWVKRQWGIEFGSMSRLNNAWVWRNKPPAAKEKETA